MTGKIETKAYSNMPSEQYRKYMFREIKKSFAMFEKVQAKVKDQKEGVKK